MRYLFLLMIMISYPNISYPARYQIDIDECLQKKAYEIASGEVGVTEKTGRNDGPRVEAYLRVTGLGKGYPYCAAGISWSYLQAAKSLNKTKSFIPFPITAGSQVVYNHVKSVGVQTKNIPSDGDMLVWRKKSSYNGHIAMIDSIGEKGWVYTIEFNTSSSNRGNQRDGGGVHRKKRNVLHPLGRMMVRGIVGLRSVHSDLCLKPKKKVIITKSDIVKKDHKKDFLEMFRDFLRIGVDIPYLLKPTNSHKL